MTPGQRLSKLSPTHVTKVVPMISKQPAEMALEFLQLLNDLQGSENINNSNFAA
jgi:hypothetical protein